MENRKNRKIFPNVKKSKTEKSKIKKKSVSEIICLIKIRTGGRLIDRNGVSTISSRRWCSGRRTIMTENLGCLLLMNNASKRWTKQSMREMGKQMEWDKRDNNLTNMNTRACTGRKRDGTNRNHQRTLEWMN